MCFGTLATADADMHELSDAHEAWQMEAALVACLTSWFISKPKGLSWRARTSGTAMERPPLNPYWRTIAD